MNVFLAQFGSNIYIVIYPIFFVYFILKKGKLREIISLAIKRAGSIRKLQSRINIPRSTIFEYYQEKHAIKEENLNKILEYLNIKINENDISKKLPDNWKQILGGKIGVEIKRANGTFEEQLENCRKKGGGGKSLRLWHANMKRKNSKEYYKLQYERFKKAGNYKFETKNGERVRNELEKEVADKLGSLGINYQYEPFIKIGGKGFFPDFLINNKIIIECTEWRGYDKATKLKEKIKYLKKMYRVYVLIPKALNRYYETLNQYLILGSENLIPIFKFL